MTMESDSVTANDRHVLVHLPAGDLTIAEKIAPMPKSLLICYNCRRTLEFLTGPSQVRCTQCQAVNRVPTPKLGKEKCANCRVML